MQTKSEKQIRELQKRYDDVCAEQEELHLKYESQIALTKKEYDEKIAQMDVMLKKNLKDRELKFENDIVRKENECQEKLNALTVASEKKLKYCLKTMDIDVKTLHTKHQCTIANLTNLSIANEKKWVAQLEKVKKEMSEIKKYSDTIVSKLDQKLTEAKVEIVSLKKKNKKKYYFSQNSFKIAIFFGRKAFCSSKKKMGK